jgi:hypothetical protein
MKLEILLVMLVMKTPSKLILRQRKRIKSLIYIIEENINKLGR